MHMTAGLFVIVCFFHESVNWGKPDVPLANAGFQASLNALSPTLLHHSIGVLMDYLRGAFLKKSTPFSGNLGEDESKTLTPLDKAVIHQAARIKTI